MRIETDASAHCGCGIIVRSRGSYDRETANAIRRAKIHMLATGHVVEVRVVARPDSKPMIQKGGRVVPSRSMVK